ncbi:hypothetical protein R1flu_003957 [Riccia fluitans]|uniref:Uncharacterized protein n=1 Tax=Riccia fluitans TaxID=41844 RepID=A0ABD1YNX2_9MARC
MSSSIQEPDHEYFELNDMEEVEEMPKSELSSDLWDIFEATRAPSTMEADVNAERDETNDLEVYGHEARHGTQPRRAFFRVFQLDADERSTLRSPVGGEVDKGEEVTWRYRAKKFRTQVVGQFGTC